MCTVISKFIANFMKKAKLTLLETQHLHNVNLKLAFPKETLFHPQLITYTDGITTTHINIVTTRTQIQPDIHNIHTWTKSSNIILNSDKTACTPFTPHPTEYNATEYDHT